MVFGCTSGILTKGQYWKNVTLTQMTKKEKDKGREE